MTHEEVDGTRVGQHPLVTRFLKGVFNSRPPAPKYVATWDVDWAHEDQAIRPSSGGILPFLSGRDPKLCPVTTLRSYKERTQRNTLFISVRKPHKPVTPATIGHWLKNMKSAGIDTSTFTAHSTRGAATSKAKRIGTSIGDILKVANWTSESTFGRFYNRPIEGVAFGRQALQTRQHSWSASGTSVYPSVTDTSHIGTHPDVPQSVADTSRINTQSGVPQSVKDPRVSRTQVYPRVSQTRPTPVPTLVYPRVSQTRPASVSTLVYPRVSRTLV